MLLDLTRYRQRVTPFSRTFEPGEVGQDDRGRGDEAYRIAAPVVLAFDVHRDADAFRLVGRVQARLALTCGRCLEPFEMAVDAPFDLRYLPAAQMTADADREMREDDAEISYYRDGQIDLDDLLREQFYLQLPMKPLCDEACRGLCPQCGTNRNAGDCGCVAAWEDPRLAPLRGLRPPSGRSGRS